MLKYFARLLASPQPRVERRVSRRVYAYGVLNTVTDAMVTLLPGHARDMAHMSAGERNWAGPNRQAPDFHVVVPLIAADRVGDHRA